MPTTYTENTFATTYKDDYDKSKNYHKILFNSGRALQARELTQLQTIIQQQFSQLAGNLFNEGASITPGSFRVDNKLEFIKIESPSFPDDPSVLEGLTFRNSDSSIEFLVVNAIAAENSDPDTLFVEYLKDQSQTTQGTRISAGEEITSTTGSSFTFNVQTTNTSLNPAVGLGSAISVDEGHFFIQGHVVYCPPQKLIFRKYETDQSSRFGFKITQDIVNVDDDATLYDNQGATPNLTSPGADRYRITLTLADGRVVKNNENFIPIIEVVGGQIVSKTTTSSGFKSIKDEMAIRTHEESGDYVRRYFRASFEPNNATTFKLKVTPGTAYVKGYRINKDAPTTILSDRPTDTIIRNNDAITVDYGNYFLYTDGKGDMPDFTSCQELQLRDAVNGGGNAIGTTNVRALNSNSSVLGTRKLHVFNTKITNPAKTIRDIKSIVTDTGDATNNYVNLYQEQNQTALYQTSQRNLIFDSPLPRPKTFTDHLMTVAKKKSVTASGTTATLNVTSGNALANSGEWIVSSPDSDHVDGSFISFGTNSSTINGLANGVTYEVMHYEQIPNPQRKQKTLTKVTGTYGLDSDGQGVKFLDLAQTDLYRINACKANDVNGKNVLSSFKVDNGQRDTHYDLAKLIYSHGLDSVGQNVYVDFDYFAHGTGDFFDVSSYSGQVDYVNLPVHRTENGRLVSLRDVIDLRPTVNGSGNFTSGLTLDLPQANTLINADGEYFMPRLDKLVLSKGGELRLIMGVPSLQPKYPSTPVDCIDLYKIQMNANTLHTKDIETTIIPRRGYTMEDINKIEKRLDKLEQATTLSLLEVNAANERLFDSTGEERIHTGFFVDNFKNQKFTDTKSIEHRASMDVTKGLIRPGYKCRSTFLNYDSDNSTNTVKKGDNVYLAHTEKVYLSQTVASRTINVNPFHVEKTAGDLVLSPSKDTWMEIDHDAPLLVDGGTEFSTDQGLLYNIGEYSWSGIDVADLQVGMTSEPLVATSLPVTTLIGTDTSFIGQKVTEDLGDWVSTGSTSTNEVLSTGTEILSQTTNRVVGDTKEVTTKDVTYGVVGHQDEFDWDYTTGQNGKSWPPGKLREADEWVFQKPANHNFNSYVGTCPRSNHNEHADVFVSEPPADAAQKNTFKSTNPYTAQGYYDPNNGVWTFAGEGYTAKKVKPGGLVLIRGIKDGKFHLRTTKGRRLSSGNLSGKRSFAIYVGDATAVNNVVITDYYTDVSTEIETYSRDTGIQVTTTNTSLAKTDTVSTTNYNLTTEEYNTATETTTSVARIVSESVLEEIVDNRVLQILHIPFMRSRKVSFKATNLRPNTRYFPFFNDTDVSRFCKPKTFYKSSTLEDPDYFDVESGANMVPEVELPTSTEHSEGSGSLISDGNGVLEGEFEIPNIVQPPMRFPTGTALFELYDVSVPDKDKALSYASQRYTSAGAIQSLQGEYTVTTTRVLETSGIQDTTVDNDRFTTHTVSSDDPIVASNIVTDEKVEITRTPVHGETEVNTEITGTQSIHVGQNVTYDYAQGQGGLASYVYDNEQTFIPRYGTGDGVVTIQPKGAVYKDEDPTAQSFEVLDPNGITLTRVRLFFAEKPSAEDIQHGVSIAITEAPAGKPDRTRRVPGSLVNLIPSQVRTLAESGATIGDMLSTGTDFVFDEPIFLQGNGANYAIIIRSKSMKYKLYISQVKEFLLGSTDTLIQQQPTLGSLFVSQNTDVWEPRGEQDLAFVFYRAEFETKGTVQLANRKLRPMKLVANPIMTDENDDSDGSGNATVTVFAEGHGLRKGDKTRIFGLTSSTSYNGIQGSEIMSEGANKAAVTTNLLEVQGVDATSIRVKVRGKSNANGRTGGGTVTMLQHLPFEQIRPDFDIVQPETTNYTFSAKMYDNSPLSDSDGTRFVRDTNFTLMKNKTRLDLDKEYCIFNTFEEETENNFVNPLDANDKFKSFAGQLVLTTADTRVSPILDMESSDLKLTHNVIDNNDEFIDEEFIFSDELDNRYNELDEENILGGTVAAKHVCIPIDLAQSSQGISVKMGVNRPPDTGIGLYYRTCNKDQNIKNVSWNYISPEGDMPADTNKNNFREYQFVIGDNPVQPLTRFDRFQLKIVFSSLTAAKVPVIKSLRVIALAD
jgi:hypothetical protein